jgi:hypothetical protein
MSAREYFVSAEARQAKRWDMVEQHKDAISKLNELGNELKQFAHSWREMADTYDHWKEYIFRVNDDGIEVKRPARAASHGDGWASDRVAKVPSAHFDFESIATLLRDLERTKKEVDELESQVKDIGAA